jgi:hypothetical protein
MKWLYVLLGLALALTGCKGLKDMQRPDLVGDTQTKLYYKNVPDNEAKVPQERRVYFKSQDEAASQGYTNSQTGVPTGADTGAQ